MHFLSVGYSQVTLATEQKMKYNKYILKCSWESKRPYKTIVWLMEVKHVRFESMLRAGLK
jgi:hypothetical protein